jgi:hypothetical protein
VAVGIEHFCAAICPFPGSGKLQVPLQVGDIFNVFEESSDWYRGTRRPTDSLLTSFSGVGSGNRSGIFPKRYVKVSGQNEDAAVNEVHAGKPSLLALLSVFVLLF